MNHRLRSTFLLLEFALRTILVVWQEPCTVAWDRQGKTICLTIHNIRECHLCGKPGVVLASDVFSPEVALWFCAEHWPEYEAIMSVVEDRREGRDDH